MAASVPHRASRASRPRGRRKPAPRQQGPRAVRPAFPTKANRAAGVTSPATDPDSVWRLWQLADSAFPTGGFAHSCGLEAAWQHGAVRNRSELEGFVESSLTQLGYGSLPFVTAAHRQPGALTPLDHHCDVFLTNHIANRASRAQGRALLAAARRIFGIEIAPPEHGHQAPVFGACLRLLGVSLENSHRLFVFNHLRTLLAAAVRLNIVGPLEAQALQHRTTPQAQRVAERCGRLGLDDLAQTAPLLELWQATQDRLYSRLFQS